MPILATKKVVLRFLDEVDRLIQNHKSEVSSWQATLGAYVNRVLVEETEKANGNFMDLYALHMLRRSLGYTDE